jgi:superfamily II DNA/RNA helicase
MNNSFEQLGMSASLVAALAKAGITVPTQIQTGVIPAVLEGRDVIGQSPTGTGKTLAYLLPLLQRVDVRQRQTQAMILAPTYELAIQIQRQLEMLADYSRLPVTAAPIIGDASLQRQVEKLKEKPHVIVGSGGRILELIQKRKINAQTIKTIVLDEADRLLDEQNADSVSAVIKTTQKDRQLLFFSATITDTTLKRAKTLSPQIEVIRAEVESPLTANIIHMYFSAQQRDKLEVLRKFARMLPGQRLLVFSNQSGSIEMLAAKLNYMGIKAAGLHKNLDRSERQKALEDFRSGRLQVLAATDVAARGLDILGVEYIVNLDMPENPKVYLHRAGRTGRAGANGTVVSLVTRAEAELLRQCEKALHICIEAKYMAHGKICAVRPENGSKKGKVRR